PIAAFRLPAPFPLLPPVQIHPSPSNEFLDSGPGSGDNRHIVTGTPKNLPGVAARGWCSPKSDLLPRSSDEPDRSPKFPERIVSNGRFDGRHQRRVVLAPATSVAK